MKNLLFPLILCLSLSAFANNLQLAQLQQLSQDELSLTISWDNSWRLEQTAPPFNHDAVWLFGKYRSGSGGWQHLDLSSLSADFSSSDSLLEVVAVSDGKGVFVRRRKDGSGQVPPISLRLRLARPLPQGNLQLRLFGIEMVHVPEGPFWLGDSLQFNCFRESDSLGGPLLISSEARLPVGTASGQLYDGGDEPPAGDLPAAFPKGFEAFYLMKYEVGQEQYVDFLNTLSFDQQAARTQASPADPAGTPALAFSPAFSNRNGIVIAQAGQAGGPPARYACEARADGLYNAADDGQNRACNFLSWADLTAYLDWAALRPLTELEFEKACRGPEYPLPGGFAWGTSAAVDANSLQQDGTPLEGVQETATATAGLASHGYQGPQGPLRAGFGGQADSDRLQIGGSYYGALEMSGNLWEQCVNLEAEGLSFRAEAGDGSLGPNGQADEASWPTTAGAGHRGGAWNSGIVGPYRDLAVSDRFYIGLFPAQRRSTTGGRGGR
jgi:formylglycine-generating enzyme required for sulfatase activity